MPIISNLANTTTSYGFIFMYFWHVKDDVWM